MKKLTNAVFSSALFAPAVWYAAIMQCENAIIDIKETYKKQTFRNRFSIYTSTGKFDISLPVSKPNGNNTKTEDVLLNNYENIKKSILSSIDTAYYSSAYYEFFRDDLVSFLNSKYSGINDINHASVEYVKRVLRLDFHFENAENYIRQDETTNIVDFRDMISPKKLFFSKFNQPAYYQVFQSKNGFIPYLSIIDLIMNEGLDSVDYLYNFPINDFINSF